MSLEVLMSCSLGYTDSEGANVLLAASAITDSVSTKRFTYDKMLAGITESAIDLGTLASLGWAMFVNRDTVNFVELRVATGGIKFCKIKPGKMAHFYFGSGVTAPFIIADTAACQVEYLILAP